MVRTENVIFEAVKTIKAFLQRIKDRKFLFLEDPSKYNRRRDSRGEDGRHGDHLGGGCIQERKLDHLP